MKIVLFGKMRSGKDTVGKILIEEHGFKRFAFGDGIAEIIQKYFPDALKGGKPRKHYQHIGQQLRVLDPNVWVKYLLRSVESYEQEHSVHMSRRVVVTDGRQLNEAIKLKEQGYLIVKVETSEEIRIQRMEELGDIFTLEQLNHETELNVDLIDADVVINNDGTYEELLVAVQRLLQDYRGRN